MINFWTSVFLLRVFPFPKQKRFCRVNDFSVSGCSTYLDNLQANTRDYFKPPKTNSENTSAYK